MLPSHQQTSRRIIDGKVQQPSLDLDQYEQSRIALIFSLVKAI
jgi:hypothetical protein